MSDEQDHSNLLGSGSALPQIGPEFTSHDGSVTMFKAANGLSYRYTWSVQGLCVSALQIVTRDGKIGLVARVFTRKEFRRKGYASSLLKRARRDFEKILPAVDLSPDGKAWTDANFYELGENG